MFYKHLPGVLSPELCQAIIADGYNRGFAEAPINMGDGSEVMLKHIRNNERVTFHDENLAAELSCYIENDMPTKFKDVWFVKLGSFFRLYKYVPGQYFKKHRDGSFEDANGSASEITVLFYLNDTDGGETVLMPYGVNMPDAFISISPKQGDVLMFEHHCWHEGKEVNSGEKFVLRSDIFYA